MAHHFGDFWVVSWLGGGGVCSSYFLGKDYWGRPLVVLRCVVLFRVVLCDM